jgi:xylose isomerase
MDAYALAFKIARRILADGALDKVLADRYASYDHGFGREIETGRTNFRQLEKRVLTTLGEPTPRSGRQEFLENLLMNYLHGR